MNLTRREKVVLIATALVFIGLLVIDRRVVQEWELALLLFFVLPVGVYLLTDKERISRL